MRIVHYIHYGVRDVLVILKFSTNIVCAICGLRNLPTKYAINAAIRTETIADGPATCRTTYPMPINMAIASVELRPTFARSNKFMCCFGAGAFVVTADAADPSTVAVVVVTSAIVIDVDDTEWNFGCTHMHTRTKNSSNSQLKICKST